MKDYSQNTKDYSQNSLIDQICKYLEHHNASSVNTSQLREGLCYGISVCESAFAYADQLEWWHGLLKKIIEFSDDQIYSKAHRELHATFEKVINHIFYHQGIDLRAEIFIANRKQELGDSFELVVDQKSIMIKEHQNRQFNAKHTDFIDELSCFLDNNKQLIEKSICIISGNFHATSLRYKDSTWHFHDSSVDIINSKKFKDVKALAAHIKSICSITIDAIKIDISSLEDITHYHERIKDKEEKSYPITQAVITSNVDSLTTQLNLLAEAKKGKDIICKDILLAEEGEEETEHPAALITAIREGNLEAVKVFVKNIQEVRSENVLEHTIDFCLQVKFFDYDYDDDDFSCEDESTLLKCAIKYNQFDIIKYFIENINIEKLSQLDVKDLHKIYNIAIKNNSTEIQNLFLKELIPYLITTLLKKENLSDNDYDKIIFIVDTARFHIVQKLNEKLINNHFSILVKKALKENNLYVLKILVGARENQLISLFNKEGTDLFAYLFEKRGTEIHDCFAYLLNKVKAHLSNKQKIFLLRNIIPRGFPEYRQLLTIEVDSNNKNVLHHLAESRGSLSNYIAENILNEEKLTPLLLGKKDKNGKTPLMLAAANSQCPRIFHLLLQKQQVKINEEQSRCLHKIATGSFMTLPGKEQICDLHHEHLKFIKVLAENEKKQKSLNFIFFKQLYYKILAMHLFYKLPATDPKLKKLYQCLLTRDIMQAPTLKLYEKLAAIQRLLGDKPQKNNIIKQFLTDILAAENEGGNIGGINEKALEDNFNNFIKNIDPADRAKYFNQFKDNAWVKDFRKKYKAQCNLKRSFRLFAFATSKMRQDVFNNPDLTQEHIVKYAEKHPNSTTADILRQFRVTLSAQPSAF